MLKIINYPGNHKYFVERSNEIQGLVKTDKYIEPFCGGGILYLNAPLYQKYLISDIDPNLVKIYNSFKYIDFKEYSQIKDSIFTEFSNIKDSKENFLSFRRYFNENIFNRGMIEEGVWLKFLSDTSFSNIFRISKNGWNAPFGKRFKDEINEESFNLIKEKLNMTEVLNKSFENIEYPKNSFVFFDPPYLNTKNSLYNKLWNEDKLEKLVELIGRISKDSYFIYTDIENEINLKLLDCDNIKKFNVGSNKTTSGKYAGATKKELQEVYYTNIPLVEIKLW